MTSTDSPYLVQVTDLLRRPGMSRRLALSFDTPVVLTNPLVELPGPLAFSGIIESVVDGLLVRGRLEAPARVTCARCLSECETVLNGEAVELFVDAQEGSAVELPEEGYEVTDGRIDLDTLLRDVLAPAAPYRPLCTPDCRGLCAGCGANLNDSRCSCVQVEVDPRWGALQGLQLRDEES